MIRHSVNKDRPSAGYTLLELLVVMVIIGILATQVVFMLSSATSRVKGAAFNMRNDLNLARSEAVNRNKAVLVDFIFNSGGRDGYHLCVDDSGDGACGAGDTVIKDVLFDTEVRFYAPAALPVPAGGPTQTSGGAGLVGQNGVVLASGNSYFSLKSDGTSSDQGTVVIYSPANGDPTVMEGKPYAVVIAYTGRVRLELWDGVTAGAWGTK